MPKLKDIVRNYFTGKLLLDYIDPNFIISTGAGLMYKTFKENEPDYEERF
jgi:hypothetical protein